MIESSLFDDRTVVIVPLLKNLLLTPTTCIELTMIALLSDSENNKTLTRSLSFGFSLKSWHAKEVGAKGGIDCLRVVTHCTIGRLVDG